MHEFSVAKSLVENVIHLQNKNSWSKVARVTIVVGKLSGFETYALESCTEIIKSELAMSDTNFCFVSEDVLVKCQDCKCETHAEPMLLHCSGCKSQNVEVTAGQSLIIKSVEIE